MTVPGGVAAAMLNEPITRMAPRIAPSVVRWRWGEGVELRGMVSLLRAAGSELNLKLVFV